MLAAPILLITQLSFTAAGFEPRIRKAFHLIQGLRATCDARISVAGTGNIGLSAIRSHIHGIGRWGKLNIATNPEQAARHMLKRPAEVDPIVPHVCRLPVSQHTSGALPTPT